MQLPTKKTPPRINLENLSALIHGKPKVGKSFWCSKSEKALFLATEPGLNSLDVFQVPITTWEEILEACSLIAKGDHDYQTIIIDTLDNAYKMCARYVCEKNNIEHESDMGYGKGFAQVNNEFQRVLTKLASLPYGLYMISHSQEKEIETRTGKYTRIVPTLPEKARKIVVGMVDMILYCTIETVKGKEGESETKRVMKTKPSKYHEAGDRTGFLPETIELNYAVFRKEFKSPSTKKEMENNEQAQNGEQKQTTTKKTGE